MADRSWGILLLVALLLLASASAQELHCCDYRMEPAGQWHPEPAKCAAPEEDCLLEPPEHDLCIDGPGEYTARERYPAPPEVMESDIVSYYCIVPQPEGEIPGSLTPCDEATDCTANSLCFNTGSSIDADNDGDSDYCAAGVWQDCGTDEQCPKGYTCIANECLARAEAKIVGTQGPEHLTTVQRIFSFGGRIIRLIINVFT